MDCDETTRNQILTSTFQRKPPKCCKKPNLAAKNKVVPKRKARSIKQIKIVSKSLEEHEDDKFEVEKKIVALQRIVPGGKDLGVDKLFEETASYIMSLQCQVKAIRALTSYFEGLEKEKRMLGG